MTTAEKHHTVTLPEYHADELGVPFKVILVDSVKERRKDGMGEVEQVIIPNLRGLTKCIANTRILVPRKLSGEEIKFIRKAFKLPAKRVAEMIGVTPEHLSRCESGDRVLSPGAEKCFRSSIFLEQFGSLDGLDKLCDNNEDLRKELDFVRRVMGKIKSIINEMKIAPTFPSDPLVLRFYITPPKEADLFEDDDGDWLSNDRELALAA